MAVARSRKTRKRPSLSAILKVLKAALRNRKGASTAAIERAGAKLGYEIPAAWRRVMHTVDGGRLVTGVRECERFEMSKARDFVDNNKFARKFIQQGWPDLPEAYLAVACTEYHDFFFLDASKVGRDGDCPVMFIGHEECLVQRKWASIAVLLKHLLGKCKTQDRGKLMSK